MIWVFLLTQFALTGVDPFVYILFLLVFYLVFLVGPAVLAYTASVLAPKLFRRRRALARLVTWSILLPLFLSIGYSVDFHILTSFSPHTDYPNLLYNLFSKILIGMFVVFPLNAFLLLTWLIGVVFMFRKNIWFHSHSANEENVKQTDNTTLLVSRHFGSWYLY